MPIPLSALPARYQEQATAQIHAKPAPKPAIIRQSSAKLNKTEQAVLEWLRGVYLDTPIHAQAITLLLANGVRYTPDFAVFTKAGLELYEAKGRMMDDAAVKLKVCKRIFPDVRLYLVWFKRGNMNIQEVIE
jgi:hypothetical protein